MLKLLMGIYSKPFKLTGYALWYGGKYFLRWTWRAGKFVARRLKGRKKVHGNASFATPKQLAKLKGGFQIGKGVTCGHETSLIFFGQRGGGKSQSMAASIRKEKSAHLLVVDPAGELHARNADVLRAAGYKVHHIDLEEGKGRLNPLSLLNSCGPNTINRYAELLVELLVQKGVVGGNSQHFIDGALMVILSSIMMEKDEPEACIGDIVERLATMNMGQMKDYATQLNKHSDSVVKRGGALLLNAGEKGEKGGFSTTIMRLTKPWLDNSIRAITSEDGIDWGKVFTSANPQAVFVTAGVGNSGVSGPFMRMIVGIAIATVQQIYNRTHKPIPGGFRVYVDEAALIGDCQPVVTAVTELRKAGVNVWLNYQSIGQVNDSFPNARTLLTNCGWLLVGGMTDDKLYREVALVLTSTLTLSGTLAPGG